MDQTFATCLAEIEKSYLVLPKAARIRVERWVEKLASTGNNPIWRKHRNEYAKLLLNMVIARNLEAPFNVSPPEGSLPPFSLQFKSYNRNLLGPHESAFWRGLYQQLQDESGNTPSEAEHADSALETSYISAVHNESKSFNKHEPLVRTTPHGFGGGAMQQPLTKEIQSLNLLIREQSQKIKLLEQQLHDERANHELQIQRLHYTNRVEVNNLKSQLEQFATELSYKDLENSRVQERTYFNTSLNTSLNGPHSPSLSVRVRSVLDAQPASRLNSSPRRYASPRSPAATTRIPSTMYSGRKDLFSFLEQKNIISSPPPQGNGAPGERIGTGGAHDITPTPQPSYQQNGQNGRSAVGNEYQEGDSRFDSPAAKDLSLHWANSNQEHSAVGDAEDEEFLAHIDRFQSEIKKINTNIVATSSLDLF